TEKDCQPEYARLVGSRGLSVHEVTMATPVTYNGVSYSIPAFGDVGYAQGPGNLSSYLIALASGPQTTGGLFSLTAPLNFGPNFGLIAVNYTTTTANPA